jgi:4-diphosphocytidyl-2-C-methyl-D-erythritol kinase
MAHAALHALARAKVNLSLRVLAREESGYHQLETHFCAIELADSLHVESGGSDIELDVRGADLGDPRGNLVFRAATAYFAAIEGEPAARILLEKQIPHGAGLGGGSSDAAATLRLLDALHGNRLGIDRLLRIGSTIGADVPFFVTGAPAALAWGRGERLLPVAAPPARELLLVVPDTAMATAQAYAALARRRGRLPSTPRAARHDPDALRDWEWIARAARNDFEAVVFERIRGIAHARDRLVELGAAPALLAGSGSALFGVFTTATAADSADNVIRSEFEAWRTFRTRTATQAA